MGDMDRRSLAIIRGVVQFVVMFLCVHYIGGGGHHEWCAAFSAGLAATAIYLF